MRGIPAVDGDSGSTFDIRYCDAWPTGYGLGLADPTGSMGNVSLDPELDDAYRPAASSPVIDAGDPALRDADGSASDMGAFGGPGSGW